MLKRVYTERSRSGFAAVPLVIAIIAVLVIGGMFLARPKGNMSGSLQEGLHDDRQISRSDWPVLWGPPDSQNKCQKNESVKYTALPLALGDIKFVEPIGELREGHIIPGDHGGFDYKTSPTSSPVKVFVPADGFLVNVEKHPYTPPAGYPKDTQHYHVYLEHSCTFFTGFVHLTEFSPEILAADKQLEQLTKDRGTQQKQAVFRIPVKAGQQLGTAWSFGLLGMVTVDLTQTNKGYLNPESYKGENWRIHSVAGLEYFEEPLEEKLSSKNPRVADPRGGKIDFDIEGKLSGNWFEKDTGGFRDLNVAPKQCGNFPCPYWDGHIAFVYDYIDPLQLRISIGHDWGLSGRTPFGVKGNGPDFKDIGVEKGLVKYELVALKDISREKGYDAASALITVNDETKVVGTLFVKLEDKNSIKVEIFPGKIKDQVSNFTPNARVYVR